MVGHNTAQRKRHIHDMKNVQIGRCSVHISSARFRAEKPILRTDPLSYLRNLVQRMFGIGPSSQPYVSYIMAHLQHIRTRRIGILDAHGCESARSWKFRDGRNLKLVQDWVTRHDGEHACLLLHVCNPEHYAVFSEHSPILVPRTTLSLVGRLEGTCQVDMYIPNRGMFDHVSVLEEYRFRFGRGLRRSRRINSTSFAKFLTSPPRKAAGNSHSNSTLRGILL